MQGDAIRNGMLFGTALAGCAGPGQPAGPVLGAPGPWALVDTVPDEASCSGRRVVAATQGSPFWKVCVPRASDGAVVYHFRHEHEAQVAAWVDSMPQVGDDLALVACLGASEVASTAWVAEPIARGEGIVVIRQGPHTACDDGPRDAQPFRATPPAPAR